tara:strand:+ start:220 stop:1197 length:978 start_codon:yes stop_codon:yes gene_type:complete
MSYSVGKAIRELNSGLIKNSYFLSGNDYFLQNFFIKRLRFKIGDNVNIKYLNFEEDLDKKILIDEIDSLSLFSNNFIYVIRNFSKTSAKIKNRLVDFINNSDSDNILVFVSDDYYSKNNFINTLTKKSYMIDTRTPFQNKIKEWVVFYLKTEKFNIDNHIIEELCISYNESISSIINEIEKLFLFNKNIKISYDEFNGVNGASKSIRSWNLVDNIGTKNLKIAVENLNLLIMNGENILGLNINIGNFFKVLLIENLDPNNQGFNGFNKIINNKMKYYKNKYSIEEISNIIISIKNIDILMKTTSLNAYDMLIILITRICKGYYAK